MTIDVRAFRFGGLPPRGAHVARVPAGVDSKTALFRALVPALALPGYFGANWDALEECLKDLSWIEKKTVALVHEDLPALPKKDLSAYLSILSESVTDWKEGEAHSLVVVFPSSARNVLAPKSRA